MNPIYIVEEEGTLYTLDGSQRTSTCIDHINNNFSLSKDTPNVVITSKTNGESTLKEYEIAGKKFKKLDKEVQDTLLSCSLEFCTLSEYTDEEVKEMFKRKTHLSLLGENCYVFTKNQMYLVIRFTLLLNIRSWTNWLLRLRERTAQIEI